MIDPTTTHARMTRHLFGGSASSDSPMQPARGLRPSAVGPLGGCAASPASCVLAHLDLPRPRAHVAAEPII
jgi:hypothetical protein